MITDLSEMLVKLREKATLAKLYLKEHILNYISLSKAKGQCAICDSVLVSTSNCSIYKYLKDNHFYIERNERNDKHCPFSRRTDLFYPPNSMSDYAAAEISSFRDRQEYKFGDLFAQSNPMLTAYNGLLMLVKLNPENFTAIPENMQINLECIQNKLCKSCIVKVHCMPPLFSLNLNFPDSFVEEVKFLNLLNSLHHHNSNELMLRNPSFKTENMVNLTQIQEIHDEDLKNVNNKSFFDRLLESYRSKIKRIRLKTAKEKQIEYKISVVREQIQISMRSYRVAIEKGRFDDAEQFKEVFYNLFNLRIKLEEKFKNLQP